MTKKTNGSATCSRHIWQMRKNGCRTSSTNKVAYENAISREKEIEHSMTMATNPFPPTNSPTSEKELTEPCGRGTQAGIQTVIGAEVLKEAVNLSQWKLVLINQEE